MACARSMYCMERRLWTSVSVCVVFGAVLLAPGVLADALECVQANQHGSEICHTDGACFVKASRSVTHIHSEVSSGCVAKEDVPLVCDNNDHLTTGVLCCYDNLCNGFVAKSRNLRSFHEAASTNAMDSEPSNMNNNKYELEVVITAVICVVVTTIAIAIVISGVVYCYCFRSNQRRRRRQDVESGQSHSRIAGYHNCCEAFIPQGQSIQSLLSISQHHTSSLSTMVQRSIVRQTALERRLEKSEMCELFVGKWRRERVLVKIYPSEYEKIWFSETEITQLPHMAHVNILGFIAADISHVGGQPRHHLINVYHERGCLFEYLQKTVIDSDALLVLGASLACGLSHLHSQVTDNQGALLKPAVVHRNLTSRSVYVKNDGTCCIGDFSLAVRDEGTLALDLRGLPLGNPRYLAPEILDGSLTKVDMCSLKRTDMYSFGLVLWELATRCSLQGVVTEAQLPYSHVIPSSPAGPVSLEEMRCVVCEQQHRPPVADKWSTDETMSNILTIITECWRSKSEDRPNSSQVNKLFNKLLEDNNISQGQIALDKNGKVLKQDGETNAEKCQFQTVS